MNINEKEEVHLYLHTEGLTITVNHILRADKALMGIINSIKEDFAKMATNVQEAIDQLTADVAAETTANQSAIALIQGFAAQLAAAVAAATAAGATPVQLQAFTDLAAGVEKNTADLAAAVTAGTPAA